MGRSGGVSHSAHVWVEGWDCQHRTRRAPPLSRPFTPWLFSSSFFCGLVSADGPRPQEARVHRHPRTAARNRGRLLAGESF